MELGKGGGRLAAGNWRLATGGWLRATGSSIQIYFSEISLFTINQMEGVSPIGELEARRQLQAEQYLYS